MLSGDSTWLKALKRGVAANIEHQFLPNKLYCKTIVDIGANRGQFALMARHSFPEAKIISFEPLPEPSEKFRQIFSDDSSVVLHNIAIGSNSEDCSMHVSARDDSSSLLPISSLQEDKFPGTGEVDTIEVHVAPLNSVMNEDDIDEPAMLKLDVQGFEMDALLGCESLLHKFEWVYCECSFVELYSGQKLAADVIAWLADKGFNINGVYNTAYDDEGLAIQADFLFQSKTMDRTT